MSGSSFLVAVNALLLKRLRLPAAPAAPAAQPAVAPEPEPVSQPGEAGMSGQMPLGWPPSR
jgi:P-type Cu2+ transporter